ncbi:MAG: carbon-nitrogen hydrolase family protein [Chloroflexota bacterium]|nr:carbon-nitrogen hydrolase family protein [Chloroflexota bacterium]
MKVTVCQLPNDLASQSAAFDGLVTHVREAGSDLVLLPEMPFSLWFFSHRPDERSRRDVWHDIEGAHDAGIVRLAMLAPAIVAATRPVTRYDKSLNEGFIWSTVSGYQPVHQKYYLPEEDGFWEASWYARGDGAFEPIAVNDACMGFMICSELWFFERARVYGRAGVNILLTPRCTEAGSVDKWVMGGRAAAVSAGAYSLSSNRSGRDNKNAYGGSGWVISPDGDVLGVTSEEMPYLTVYVDLEAARQAKHTYPRYIEE